MEKDIGQRIVEAAQACFNCREVFIGPEGRVWIGNQQTGHWLEDHERETLANYLKAG